MKPLVGRQLSPQEIVEYFPAAFRRAFGGDYAQQCPSIVVMAEEDGVETGFISGFFLDTLTFYIQFVGIYPEFRGGKRMLRYLRTAMELIGARFYTTKTHIYDRMLQATLLRMEPYEFVVNGFNVDTGGTPWVSMIATMPNKEQGNG